MIIVLTDVLTVLKQTQEDLIKLEQLAESDKISAKDALIEYIRITDVINEAKERL